MQFAKHIICLLIVSVSGVMLHINAQTVNASFRLLPESNFQVNGSTNVIDFFCASEQGFTSLTIPVTQTETQIQFGHNSLKARTRSLDCGGSGINKDMYKCLKADSYPNIIIELQKITLQHKLQNSNWITGTVKMNLTIAGTKRSESFPIQIMMLPGDTYKLKGKHTIYLTNYYIDPPKAMLGLITVNNEIELVFDLVVMMQPG